MPIQSSLSNNFLDAVNLNKTKNIETRQPVLEFTEKKNKNCFLLFFKHFKCRAKSADAFKTNNVSENKNKHNFNKNVLNGHDLLAYTNKLHLSKSNNFQQVLTNTFVNNNQKDKNQNKLNYYENSNVCEVSTTKNYFCNNNNQQNKTKNLKYKNYGINKKRPVSFSPFCNYYQNDKNKNYCILYEHFNKIQSHLGQNTQTLNSASTHSACDQKMYNNEYLNFYQSMHQSMYEYPTETQNISCFINNKLTHKNVNLPNNLCLRPLSTEENQLKVIHSLDKSKKTKKILIPQVKNISDENLNKKNNLKQRPHSVALNLEPNYVNCKQFNFYPSYCTNLKNKQVKQNLFCKENKTTYIDFKKNATKTNTLCMGNTFSKLCSNTVKVTPLFPPHCNTNNLNNTITVTCSSNLNKNTDTKYFQVNFY